MIPQFEALSRRIGRFPIETPAAALAAAAVALAALALPDWRFENAITASGLPAIMPAAQPPLGQAARLLVALLLAGGAVAAVWFGLRALDRKPVDDAFPAFRAADFHPDAPRRRPILAGAEFGAPVVDLPPIETHGARRNPIVDSLPSFLTPQPPEIGNFVPEPVISSEPQDADFEELEEDWDTNDAVMTDASTDSDDLPNLMARLETGLARIGSIPRPGPASAAREQLSRALEELDRASARGR